MYSLFLLTKQKHKLVTMQETMTLRDREVSTTNLQSWQEKPNCTEQTGPGSLLGTSLMLVFLQQSKRAESSHIQCPDVGSCFLSVGQVSPSCSEIPGRMGATDKSDLTCTLYTEEYHIGETSSAPSGSTTRDQ